MAVLLDGATSIVFDGNGTVVIDLDGNGSGESCHGFVDGVVVALPNWQGADEVVQTVAAGFVFNLPR